MRKLTSYVFALLCVFNSFTANAGLDEGISWLKSQQVADGSLRTASKPLSTHWQATAEAASALLAIDGANSAEVIKATGFLNTSTVEETTTSLSQRVIFKKALKEAHTDLLAKLLPLQNKDGGFGDQKGYASSAYDTAIAVQALKSVSYTDSTVLQKALGYLSAVQQADGGYPVYFKTYSKTYVTAEVISALYLYRFTFDVNASLEKARNYLLGQRNVEGSWGTAWETAKILISLLPNITNVEPYQALIDSVTSAQLNDGSWDKDVYATAVVLKLLHSLNTKATGEVPTDTDKGRVTGAVVNARSGIGIINADIFLYQNNTVVASTKSGGNGQYSLNDVAPGSYSLRLSVAGFNTTGVSINLTVVAAQTSALPKIELVQSSSLSILSGTVAAKNSGAAIPSANITLTKGSDNFTATSDDVGNYSLAVNPGTYTLTASASGYYGVSLQVELKAGEVNYFSPSMVLSSEADPQNLPVSIAGQVRSKATSEVISGVVATVLGTSATVNSDQDGLFALAGLAAGSIQLSLKHPDYFETKINITASPGSKVSLGEVALVLKSSVESSIAGVVVNNDGGAAMPGVLVKLSNAQDSYTATSDASGAYRMIISAGTYVALVEKSGFHSVSLPVTVPVATNIQFSPVLVASDQPDPANQKLTLKGFVKDFSSKNTISGVSVSIVGKVSSTILTDSDGSFSLTDVSPGELQIDLQHSAYANQSYALVVSGTGEVSLGDLLLGQPEQPKSINVVGKVLDSQNGSAVSGAVVLITEFDKRAVTNALGEYAFTDLNKADFDIQVSATGYLERNAKASVSASGTTRLDLELQRINATGIEISEIRLPLGSRFEAFGEAEIEAVIKNTGVEEKQLRMYLKITDSTGQLVDQFPHIRVPLGSSPRDALVPVIAGGAAEAEVEWYFTNTAPGLYTVIVQAFDGETNGLVAERAAVVEILLSKKIGGDVQFDPPITHLSAEKEIHIKSKIINHGNVPIPEGVVKAEIRLKNKGVAVTPASITPTVLQKGIESSQITSSAYSEDGGFYYANRTGYEIYSIKNKNTVALYNIRDVSNDFYNVENMEFYGEELHVLVRGRSGYTILIYPESGGHREISLAGRIQIYLKKLTVTDSSYFVTDGKEVLKISRVGLQVKSFVKAELNSPTSIAEVSSGALYIANTGDSNILLYENEKFSVYKNIPGLVDIASNGKDKLYVSTSVGQKVYEISDPRGNEVETELVSNQGVMGGLSYSEEHGLFGIDGSNGHRVVNISNKGSLEYNNPLSSPVGILKADNGHYWFADSSGLVSQSEAGERKIEIPLSGIKNIAYSKNENSIYVNNGALHKYNLSTKQLKKIDDISFSFLSGVSSVMGDVVVADSSGKKVAKIEGSVDNVVAQSLYEEKTRYGTAFATDGSTVYLLVDEAGNFNVSKIIALSGGGEVRVVADGLPRSVTGSIVYGGDGTLWHSTNKKIIKTKISTGEIEAEYPVSVDPYWLSLGPNQEVLFATFNGREIHQLNPDGSESPYMDIKKSYIYGEFHVPSEGEVFYSNTYQLIYEKGETQYQVSNSGGVIKPVSDGILVASNNGVKKFTAHGVLSQYNELEGVAEGSYVDGVELESFYWLMLKNGDIQIIDKAKKEVLKTFRNINNPTAIVENNYSDELYVIDSGDLVKTAHSDRLSEIIEYGSFKGGMVKNGVIYTYDFSNVFKHSESGFSTIAKVHGVSSILLEDSGISVTSNSSSTLSKFSYTGDTISIEELYGNPDVIHVHDNQLVMSSRKENVTYTKLLSANDANFVFRQTYSDFYSLNGTLYGNKKLAGIESINLATKKATKYFDVIRYNQDAEIIIKGNGDIYYLSGDRFMFSKAGSSNPELLATPISAITDIYAKDDGNVYIFDRNIRAAVNYKGLVTDYVSFSIGGDSAEGDFVAYDDKLYLHTKGYIYEINNSNTKLDSYYIGEVKAVEATALNKIRSVTGEGDYIEYLLVKEDIDFEEGDVVYRAEAVIPAMPVGRESVDVNFGGWKPKRAGDYSIKLTSNIADGSLANLLHVGNVTNADFTIGGADLLPGDGVISASLNLTALDSTSITYINSSAIELSASSNTTGRGVTADSEGNVYALGNREIIKIYKDGSTDKFFEITSSGFFSGLDIDYDNNLYVSTFNELLKISPSGSFEVLSDQGFNAIAVDRSGNLFAANNAVYKVIAPGELELVASLPGRAASLSVDAYGDIYTLLKPVVLFSGVEHQIYRVTQEGGVSLYYSDALFEYEGVNVISDCSNNLLFSPTVIDPYQPKYQEENKIIQLVGDTRETRVVLDGGPIDRALLDIDVLHYDKLNNRILAWTDLGAGKVFAFPVVCGGLDAKINVIARNDVHLQFSNISPTTSLSLPDGKVHHIWEVDSLTPSGEKISLSATFTNLVAGEKRPLVSEAYIEYQNSFAPEENIRVPIKIPSVSVRPPQALALSTNKPAYSADEDVVISLLVENRSNTAFNGTVQLKIVDSSGITVETLAPLTVINVLKDNPAQLSARWNTGLTYSADYRIEATLLDEQSADAGQSEDDFTINPAGLDNSLANISLLVDKLSYNAWDSVQLTGRLRNLTSNSILPESVSTLVVKNPDGSSLYTASATSNELISKSFKDMFFTVSLVDATAGTFTAEITSRHKTSNVILAAGTASFTVNRSVFAGLVGKVQVTPQVIYSGQNTQCQFSTENSSVMNFDDIDLRYQVVSLTPESVFTEQNETVQILAGSQRSNSIEVDAKNFAVGRFACLLKTIVGGQEQNLAAAIFEVREPARIQVTPASLSMAEQGGTGSVAIVLSARPQNDVSITLASNAEVSLQSSSLVFNSSNWNQEQSVVITAVDDAIDRDDSALLIVSVDQALSDNNYANTPDVEVLITIQDDDQAALLIGQTTVTIAEPSSQAPLNIRLASQPVGDVVVALASASNVDALVSPASLTFTAANWNQPQTAMVAAVDDLIDRNDTTRITASIASAVSDMAYKVVAPKMIPVTIIDNDVAGLNVSPQTIRIAENAGQGSIAVSLQTQPTADVFISLNTVDSSEISMAKNSLQFTPANWNVAQAVAVTSINDDYDRNDSAQVSISIAANSLDTIYQSVQASSVIITIDDDDVAGLNIPSPALTLAEAAGTTTVPVSLSARPTGTVVLAVSSDKTTEMTVSPATLQFDASNWNVVQHITVTAVDDAVDRDDSAKLNIALQSSADDAFQNIATHSIDVAINDDDTAAWIVDPTSVSVDEKAGIVTATVKLASEPTAEVLVDLVSSAVTEVTVAASQLSFNAGNWQQSQTITITAVDDAVSREDSASISLQATGTTADLVYRNLAAAQIAVTINNDDQPGVTLSATSFTIAEQAGKASLGIQLDSQPEAEVVLSITADNQEVELGTQQLRFTAANWNQSQAVQITAVDDKVDRNDSAVISVAIDSTNQDAQYNGLATQDVAITITNDDSASFALSATALTIDEQAGTATFTAVLGSQPEGAVQLSVISEDTAEATVSLASVSFNEQNWNQPQTVTVTGVDDLIDRNDMVNLNVKVATAPQDTAYQSLATQQVKVTLTNNDKSSISIEPGALSIGENAGTGQLIVRLGSQPAQAVNLTVSSADLAEAIVSLPELNFTADNWDSGLTVTVTGVNDNTLDNDSTVISVKAKGGSDASYQALAKKSIPVTLVNDDILNVTGSVTVASNPIQQGEAQVCDFSIINEGTVEQPTLLVWKELLKSDGTAVHSTRQTLSLTAGASTTISESFTTTGLAEGTYRCALSAQLQSQREALAEVSFALETAEIKLETKLDLVQQGRVLILMDEGQPTCTATTSVTLEGNFHKSVGAWSNVYAKAFDRHSLLDYEVGEPGAFAGAINNNGYYSNVDVSITDLSQQHIRMRVDAEDVFEGSLKFYSYYEWKRRLHHINTGTVHFECGKPAQVGDKWGQFTVTAVETRELIVSDVEESHCPSQSSGHRNGYGNGHYHHGNGHGYGHHNEQEERAENPTVESQRSYLEALLNTAGISHTIVDSIDDFRNEQRSGLYNQYLITAERLEVDKDLARELREAVHRGEGLIVASGSDLEPEVLFDTLGLEYPRWKGGLHKGWHQESDYHWGHGWQSKWTYGWHHRSSWKHDKVVKTHSTASGVALTDSPVSAVAQAPFSLQREILDVNTDGAQTVGTLTDALPSFDYQGDKPERDYPVVSIHNYGDGHAAYIGFDLLAEATLGQGNSAGLVYQNLILGSLGYAVPEHINSRAGAAVPLQLDVRNLGKHVAGNSQFSFSEGTQMVDAMAAVEQAPGYNWGFDLAEEEKSHITLWLQPEYQQGQAWAEAAIRIDQDGVPQDYEVLRKDILETVNAGESIEAICDDIAAQHDADGYSWKALTYLHKAHKQMEYGRYDDALQYLLEVTDALRKSGSAASPAIRKDVDWLLWHVSQQAGDKRESSHSHHSHHGHK